MAKIWFMGTKDRCHFTYELPIWRSYLPLRGTFTQGALRLHGLRPETSVVPAPHCTEGKAEAQKAAGGQLRTTWWG